jgi:hypothetical protein
MKFSFVAKQTPDYLHATVTGNNTAENVRRYLAEVIKTCTEQGCTRILIEENLRGPSLGTTDVYALVTEGAQNAPSWLQQVAYVDVNPEHDVGLLAFAETVAVNRGVNVRRFATVEEAARWLSGDAGRGSSKAPG